MSAKVLHARISALLILAESPVTLDTALLLEVLREARQFVRSMGLLDAPRPTPCTRPDCTICPKEIDCGR